MLQVFHTELSDKVSINIAPLTETHHSNISNTEPMMFHSPFEVINQFPEVVYTMYLGILQTILFGLTSYLASTINQVCPVFDNI